MGNGDCTVVQRELPWLVNGSLSSDLQRSLWQHLGTCRDCRSDLIAWSGLAAKVRAAAVDAPPEALDAVWKSIRRRVADPEGAGQAGPVLGAVFPPLTVAGDIMRWAVARAMELADEPPSARPFYGPS